jgi:hypothetical protein
MESFPGGCFFINLSIELDDQAPHLAQEIDKGFTGFRNMILRLLHEAKENGELKDSVYVNDAAELVFAGIMGAAIIYGQGKSQGNLNRSITAITNYIKGLIN